MKKRLRWLVYGLLLLAIAGGVAYGASWLNSRRYFLVVGPASVEVGKGKMFPVGHEPFQPTDASTRRAYRGFELPGGIKLARGTTVFTDRVELDQALFRILTDAARYAMSKQTPRAPELVQGYIEQLEALPGVSIEQQVELQRLTRQAEYAQGRQHVRDAADLLDRAAEAFDASGGPNGPNDAEAWSTLVEKVRERLVAGPADPTPVPSTPLPTTATTSSVTE